MNPSEPLPDNALENPIMPTPESPESGVESDSQTAGQGKAEQELTDAALEYKETGIPRVKQRLDEVDQSLDLAEGTKEGIVRKEEEDVARVLGEGDGEEIGGREGTGAEESSFEEEDLDPDTEMMANAREALALRMKIGIQEVMQQMALMSRAKLKDDPSRQITTLILSNDNLSDLPENIRVQLEDKLIAEFNERKDKDEKEPLFQENDFESLSQSVSEEVAESDEAESVLHEQVLRQMEEDRQARGEVVRAVEESSQDESSDQDSAPPTQSAS